jgi:hypothetical protein
MRDFLSNSPRSGLLNLVLPTTQPSSLNINQGCKQQVAVPQHACKTTQHSTSASTQEKRASPGQIGSAPIGWITAA